jgi:hypothetical protein
MKNLKQQSEYAKYIFSDMLVFCCGMYLVFHLIKITSGITVKHVKFGMEISGFEFEAENCDG